MWLSSMTRKVNCLGHITKALGPAECQGTPRAAQHVPTDSVATHGKRAR